MLNPKAEKECFRQYNYEYNDLISFILANKIEGVIFLSGDRHYTELVATQPVGVYTLFDFTCSSFTSKTRSISNTSETENPYRIQSTLVTENNFGKITVMGRRGSRNVKLETLDSKGKPVWDFVINESDLKFK
jgi:alkaline phosphatase D